MASAASWDSPSRFMALWRAMIFTNRSGSASTFTEVAEPMTFEEVARVVTPDMGYVIAFERAGVRRAGSDEVVPLSLRVTTVFRREADGWRLVLRHADRTPATAQP